MPDGIVIFSLRESDIIFAFKTARWAISLGVSRISLRSNITRRKANITEKDLVLRQGLFLGGRGCDSATFGALRRSRSSCPQRFGQPPFRPGRKRTTCNHLHFAVAKCAAFLLTTTFLPKQKAPPTGGAHCFGGRGWIRTTEARRNRFTVCPLWPLGNSPKSNDKDYTTAKAVCQGLICIFCRQFPRKSLTKRKNVGILLLFSTLLWLSR